MHYIMYSIGLSACSMARSLRAQYLATTLLYSKAGNSEHWLIIFWIIKDSITKSETFQKDYIEKPRNQVYSVWDCISCSQAKCNLEMKEATKPHPVG